MKTKNFFIKSGIYILTFLQITAIILLSVFTKRFWRKFFSFFSRKKSGNRLKLEQALSPAPDSGNPNIPARPQFDTVYVITVRNTNKRDPKKKEHEDIKRVVLFGFNQFFQSANFGNPSGIEMSGGGVTYQEILAQSAFNPFSVSGFRVISEKSNQLNEVLTISKRDGNGQTSSMPVQLAVYFSAFQFQSGIREVHPYAISIDGTTQISFNMYAESDLTFTFFVSNTVNNMVSSRPAVILSANMLPETEKSATKSIRKGIKELWDAKITWKKMRWLDNGIEDLKSKKENKESGTSVFPKDFNSSVFDDNSFT